MWTSGILTLVALNLMLIGWRSDVVRWLPQTASLYAAIGLPVNLRGLVFANVTTERETNDGVEVLVVQGSIVNNFKRAVDVPRLRFSVVTRAATKSTAGLRCQTATCCCQASRCRSARGSLHRHARATASRCVSSTGAISALSFPKLYEVLWRGFLIAEDEEGLRSLVARALMRMATMSSPPMMEPRRSS